MNGETLARAACLQDDTSAGDSPVSIAASMAFPIADDTMLRLADGGLSSRELLHVLDRFAGGE